MKAKDVTDTLGLAASGCSSANVRHKPGLSSDTGSSSISHAPARWLGDQETEHVRGAPDHPRTRTQTRGKTERWQPTLETRILPETPYLPGALEEAPEAFVTHCNHCRYHESPGNLTPADVSFGRDHTILSERRKIKDRPLKQSRSLNLGRAA